MDVSGLKNSSVESEPSTEGNAVPPNRVASEGVGDEAEEGDELDDSESEVGWRQSAAALKLYRFRPGPWLGFEVPTELLRDMTNYPMAIRALIVSSIVAVLRENETFKEADRTQAEKLLNDTWGLDVDEDTPQMQEVTPDTIVPRFLWYQRELEKLYGTEAVREAVNDKAAFGSAAAVAQEEEVDPVPVTLPTPDASADSVDLPMVVGDATDEPPSQASVTPPAVDFSTLKSPIIVRKKKKKVGVATHIAAGPLLTAEGAFGDASGALVRGRMDRTDALSMTIRDMQFRLSRHGTVADPRSYMGKGDTAYDKDDPFFDDEELMMEIGLTKEDLKTRLSDAGGSGDEGEDGSNDSDVSDDENGMDRLGEIYEGTEDLFFVDNYSESSEDEGEEPTAPTLEGRGKKGAPPRVLQTFPFPKPSSCPLVYNPRGWHKVKTSLTPVTIAFFYTLECVVPSKRLPSLQKGIFETAELAVVDTSVDPPRLRLSEEGQKQVTRFLRQVFLACYSSFLHIFLPPHGPKCLPPLSLPRHCRVAWTRLEQLPEINQVLCHGFVDYDPDVPEIIESVTKSHITPYIPSRQDLTSWWWAAVAHHTFRIFAAKEDATMNDLDEFFQRHATETPMGPINERIRGWSARMKAGAKLRAQMQAKKGGSDSSSTPAGEVNSESDKRLSVTELKQVEAEMESDDEMFAVFDEVSSGVVQYAISFNLRRNIFRDIFDAGEFHLLKMFYPCPTSSSSGSSSSSSQEVVPSAENLSTTSDQEKQRLEKALSMSWAARLVQLFEDSSAKYCDTPLKPSAAWLESRLRRFRKQIKVPNLYERRKPRPPKPAIKTDGKSSPTRGTSQVTSNKRRRPGDQKSSESMESAAGPGSTPNPPSKRRKGEPPSPPKSLVTCMLTKHDLGRLLAILQMCPVLLPTTISCQVKCPLDDDPNSSTQTNIIDYDEGFKMTSLQFVLHNVESWESQSTTSESQSFNSIADALEHAENSLKGTAVINSAVTDADPKLRPWQAFTLSTEDAAYPYGQHPTGWVEDRISLLDFLALHFWIQRYDVGKSDNSVVMSSVFVTQQELASSHIPPRRLQLPAHIANNILANRFDMMPQRPEGSDRIRAGQLALLAKRHANLSQLIRHKIILPPWSHSFTRASNLVASHPGQVPLR